MCITSPLKPLKQGSGLLKEYQFQIPIINHDITEESRRALEKEWHEKFPDLFFQPYSIVTPFMIQRKVSLKFLKLLDGK